MMDYTIELNHVMNHSRQIQIILKHVIFKELGIWL